jgi:hypothetical protein
MAQNGGMAKEAQTQLQVQSLGIHTDHSQPMGICTRVQIWSIINRWLSRPKPKSTLTSDETDLFAAAMDSYLESNPPPELKETYMDDAPYLTEASDYLYKLCLHSAELELGGSTWKKNKWRTYKDGWSPSMVALQYHLKFVVKFCLKLCAAIKQRKEARFKDRTRSFLRSVLGESNTGVCLDHLYVDEDTLLNNGSEIFKELTEYYEEHYSTPMRHQGPIHTDPDWTSTYTDKQKFIQATNHHNIPD